MRDEIPNLTEYRKHFSTNRCGTGRGLDPIKPSCTAHLGPVIVEQVKMMTKVAYKKNRKFYKCYKRYIQVIFKDRYSRTVSCFQRCNIRTPIMLSQLDRHLNHGDVALPAGGVVEDHRVIGAAGVVMVRRGVLCMVGLCGDVDYSGSFRCCFWCS